MRPLSSQADPAALHRQVRAPLLLLHLPRQPSPRLRPPRTARRQGRTRRHRPLQRSSLSPPTSEHASKPSPRKPSPTPTAPPPNSAAACAPNSPTSTGPKTATSTSSATPTGPKTRSRIGYRRSAKTSRRPPTSSTTSSTTSPPAEDVLRAALELLDRPWELYRAAPDEARKKLNKAIFNRLYVDADDHTPTTGAHDLIEPYASLVDATGAQEPQTHLGGLLATALSGECASKAAMVDPTLQHKMVLVLRTARGCMKLGTRHPLTSPVLGTG